MTVKAKAGESPECIYKVSTKYWLSNCTACITKASRRHGLADRQYTPTAECVAEFLRGKTE